jgi:hypothetical protein
MKKSLMLSAALATMIFCAGDFAMAAGAEGDNLGDSMSGGSSSASERDGAAGPDREAAMQPSGGTETALADCERLMQQRKIGQVGPISGRDVNLTARDCALGFTGEAY